jgi:hypothetical protein
MRIYYLLGCATLALASTSLQAATTDIQTKCEQQLSANKGHLETGKLIGQMLGNEKLNNTLSQIEGGCAQLNAEGLAANAAGDNGTAVDDKLQAVTQAKDALIGLGRMFGK